MASINVVEYLEVNNSSFTLSENIKYDDLTKDVVIDYFNQCKYKNDIIGEYNDDTWKFKSKNLDLYITLEFQDRLGAYKDKVKCYIIMKIYKQNICAGYARQILNSLTKYIINTYYFNEKYVEDFRRYIITHQGEKDIACIILQFLRFIDEAPKYIEVLNGVKGERHNSRDIPKFESIIMFDKIVDDVILHHKEVFDKYYFILLWWKVSTIIPLRTSEFVQLKRNCIYEKDNEFYLHIERIKNMYDRKIYDFPIMTEFPITKDVFCFIKEYIDYANTIDNTEYLISREMYISTLKFYVNSGHRVNSKDFNKLLLRFYRDVVIDIYGLEVVPKNEKENEYQIEKISLGDTRHLAIINLMMQGVNPLDIMKLAGHHSIDVQMGYYSHVEKFMTSKTYVLSKMLKTNSIISDDYSNLNSVDKKIEKDLLGASFYNLPVVACGSGRCKNTNFPQDCEAKECIYCKYFLPEGKINADYLEQLAIEKQQELEIKKNILKFVLKNSMSVQNSELERASKDYITTVNQNVVIQSYRLREENVNT